MTVEDYTEYMRKEKGWSIKRVVRAWKITPFRNSPVKLIVAVREDDVAIYAHMIYYGVPIIIKNPEVLDEIIHVLEEAKKEMLRRMV